jgi:hypothetical protein
MGTPGVKFHITKQDLSDLIVKKNGRLVYVCQELGMGRQWLHERMKQEPELYEVVAQARKHYCEALTTVAEDGLMYYMSRREEYPNQALRAIMFVLNNLGKDIGYSPLVYSSGSVSDDVNVRFNAVMDQLQSLTNQSDLNNAEINISPAE